MSIHVLYTVNNKRQISFLEKDPKKNTARTTKTWTSKRNANQQYICIILVHKDMPLC